MLRNPNIIKTRNPAKAHNVARKLVAVTGRVFGVRKANANTYGVFPQKLDFRLSEINHFVRLAEELLRGENNG